MKQKYLFGSGPEGAENLVTMETTKLSVFEQRRKKPWLLFREDRSVVGDELGHTIWMFTDGSASGWHAAILVEPIEGFDKLTGSVRKFCEFAPKTSTRNVGAEMNAFLLGLTNLPRSKGGFVYRVFVVHDYLGIGAWMTGNWEKKDAEIIAKCDDAVRMIRAKKLSVKFIHHAGHQKDRSDFTRWNREADVLCAKKREVCLLEDLV